MGIGASIFLLAVGAILAFAVNANIGGLDIHVVGFILMAAGLLGLILTLVLFAQSSRRSEVIEERYIRESDEPPPPTY